MCGTDLNFTIKETGKERKRGRDEILIPSGIKELQ